MAGDAMQDRQMTITRLIAARTETVWRCLTDPDLLPRWFGPEGYSCRTKEIRLGEGGVWRFDMIGPDGRIWPNRHRYFGLIAPERLEYLMDADTDTELPCHVLVTLAPETGGVRYTLCMTFPSVDACAAARNFGAEALGMTTLGKLADLAESL